MQACDAVPVIGGERRNDLAERLAGRARAQIAVCEADAGLPAYPVARADVARGAVDAFRGGIAQLARGPAGAANVRELVASEPIRAVRGGDAGEAHISAVASDAQGVAELAVGARALAALRLAAPGHADPVRRASRGVGARAARELIGAASGPSAVVAGEALVAPGGFAILESDIAVVAEEVGSETDVALVAAGPAGAHWMIAIGA